MILSELENFDIRKILIISDTHYTADDRFVGKFDSDLGYLGSIIKFIEENGIDLIVHVGDLFDRCDRVSAHVFSFVYDKYMREIKVPIIFVAGNHDLCYLDNYDKNLLSCFSCGSQPYRMIVYDCGVLNLNKLGTTLVFVAYKKLPESIIEVLSRLPSLAKYPRLVLFGHFDVKEFSNLLGYDVDLSVADIRNLVDFDLALFGHIHKRSIIRDDKLGRVVCLGSLYQHSFSDEGNIPGFHVLTIDGGCIDLDFVENLESKRFKTIRLPYNSSSFDRDIDKIRELVTDGDYSNYYIRVVVEENNVPNRVILGKDLPKFDTQSYKSDISLGSSTMPIGSRLDSFDIDKLIDLYVDNAVTDLPKSQLKEIGHSIVSDYRKGIEG